MSFLPKAGDIFSGCEILGRCGKGSFGVTFLARNPLGKKIIIKIVSAVNRSERELEGLRNYMNVAGKHPNLLQIFHIGEIEDGFFYTMEAADNCSTDPAEYHPATLGNLIRNGKKFTPDEALCITRSLLGGVQTMHHAKLIHRDIKPDNIIFVDNQPKLSDPGLVVELGQSASFAGTFGFLPPEAVQEELPPDQGFDLYALGKVFYCMLTGNSPKNYPELPLDMPLEVCRQLYGVLNKVCSRNPVRRFKSAEEFLRALPQKIAAANRWERWCSKYRQARAAHPVRHRVILTAILLLLLASAIGISYVQHRLHLQKENQYARLAAQAAFERQKLQENAEKLRIFKDYLHKKGDLLALQLEVYASGEVAEYKRLLQKFESSARQQDLPAAIDVLASIRTFLSGCAVKMLPEISEKNHDIAGDMDLSGKAHSFLSSPLADFLPVVILNDYRKKLAEFDKVLYTQWQGPRCGKAWETMQEFEMHMAFVPGGAVKMQHNGKVFTHKHYWMGKYEVTGESLARYLDISPRRNGKANTPVERVTWNDILFYCSKLTAELQQYGKLPPGYIVRPPTESEWEFAANNGWLGKESDLQVLAEQTRCHGNSDNHTWQGGSLKPNKLGIFDMFGNVAEIVQPLEPTAMQNSAVIRGGSFKHTLNNCLKRNEQLKYQSIPYTVGFRIVIAPGTMDYFDREFFLGGATQVKLRGRVYELIGTNYGAFTWNHAHKLCGLLGGTLAELDDAEHIDELKRSMPLFGSWPTILGGCKVQDKWQWNQSKRGIDFGRWRKQTDESGSLLMLEGKSFVKVHEDTKAPVMLCQWQSAEYGKRNKDLFKKAGMPLEVLRFQWQDRTFVLFDLPVQWYAAQRICELLGGRLAVLDDGKLLQFACKNLQEYASHRIAVGAYAKRDKYLWLNGKTLEGKLKTERLMTIPSRNMNFVVLKENTLQDAQFSCMFLCEWDAKTISSFCR